MGQKPFNPFKILTILLIVSAIAAGGYFGYRYYKKISAPIANAIDAIPENASFFIEIKQNEEFFDKLFENEIWQLIRNFVLIEDANTDLLYIDSLMDIARKENQIELPEKMYIVSTYDDSLGMKSLFLFNLKKNLDIDKVLNFMKKGLPKDAKSSKYELFDNDINLYNLSNGKTFCYTIFKGVFIAGLDIELLENAMIQLQSDKNLNSIAEFKRVYQSSGKHTDATVFLQLPILEEMINELVKDSGSLGFLSQFAQWSALDMQIRKDNLVLNGFTSARDSLSDFLACFFKQKPQQNKIIEMLPSNTVYFVNYSFRDFETFYTRYKKHLKANGLYEQYNKRIIHFNKNNNCDLESDLVNWVGFEMCHLISAGIKISDDNNFALINILDRSKAEKFLSKIRDNRRKSRTTYKSFEIYKIKGKDFLDVFFSNLFDEFESNYYCIVDDYILFGGSITGIKQFLNKHLYHKTLTSNVFYKDFAELTPGESNIFMYCNVYHAADVIKDFLNDKCSKVISDSIHQFRNIQALAIQLNNDSKQFYSNVAVKFNPKYKTEPSIIWETNLDTTIQNGPYVYVDHEDGTKEIVVTDVDNSVYLIDRNGEILWKRKLSSQILGSLKQIDYYRNNKLQFIFNTKDSIYLIDRTSKNVEFYPIALEKDASAPLSVFDYEGKKNYRILIPLVNEEILNLDKDANKIIGWEFKKSKAKIKKALKHFLLERIDYITAIESNGNLLILDRRGKDKFERFNLKIAENTEVYSYSKGDVSPSLITTNKDGKVLRIFLETGKIDTWFSKKNLSKKHYFLFEDFDLDGFKDFIFLDGRNLSVFSQNKKKLLEYELKNSLNTAPLFFQSPDTTLKIGFVDKKESEIYLFSCEGKLKNGFPLKGSQYFVIEHLDKTGILNLVTGLGKTVVCYELIE